MTQKKIIASVDTGGTKVLVSLIDSKGVVVSRAKRASRTESSQSVDIVNTIIIAIGEALEEISTRYYKLSGIIIGIPGTINPELGIVYMAPNLGLVNYKITNPLNKKFKVPVVIENDANLGAIGIHSYEIKGKFNNSVSIFIGTGIGAGIIINNKLFRGSNFAAGEIGHMNMDLDGYHCGCGKNGCFETIASRTGIVKKIKRQVKQGKKTVLTKLVTKNKLIKSGNLAKALEFNDNVTKKALTEASKTIGLMIGNLVNLLNIECFVLAGGVMEAVGKFMLPIIKNSAKEYSLKQNFKGVKIINSKLGDNAAIYGGFVLAKEQKLI